MTYTQPTVEQNIKNETRNMFSNWKHENEGKKKQTQQIQIFISWCEWKMVEILSHRQKINLNQTYLWIPDSMPLEKASNTVCQLSCLALAPSIYIYN